MLPEGRNGEVLTVHSSEMFAEVVARHAVSHAVDTVVVPNDVDADHFLLEFKSIGGNSVDVLSFTDIIDAHRYYHVDRDSISCLVPLMQFIEEWNVSHGSEYPPCIAEELLLLLKETYMNCGDVSVLSSLSYSESLAEHWRLKSEFLRDFAAWWKRTLPTEQGTVSAYQLVDNFIASVQASGKKVMSAGIAFNRVFVSFLKALQCVADSKIILPFLDLELSEDALDAVEEGHYQHFLMQLLRQLGIERKEVRRIGDVRRGNKVLSAVFNFELPDNNTLNSCAYGEELSNIKLVTCDSENEEAVKIVEILQKYASDPAECTVNKPCDDETQGSAALSNEFRDSATSSKSAKKIVESFRCLNKRCVAFIGGESLLERVHSILSVEGVEPSVTDCGHIVSSLVNSVLEVVLSAGEAAHLLALLKHPLVTLGYEEEQYRSIVSEFEIDIIRKNSVSGFDAIGNVISEKSPELVEFWCNVQEVLRGLVCLRSTHSMGEILGEHWSCIRSLIAGKHRDMSAYRSSALDEMENFFTEMYKYCTTAEVFSMQSYRRVCTEVVAHYFCARSNELSAMSFARNEVVIIAGFNDGEYSLLPCKTLINNDMRLQIGLPTVGEYEGYMRCILYGLLQANCAYITRAAERRGKAMEAPVLFRYMSFLMGVSPNASDTHSTEDIMATDGIVAPEEVIVHVPNPGLDVRKSALSELTAAAVAMLVNNPYVFYTRHILGIRPVNEVNTGRIAPNFVGAVHRILSKYLRSVGVGSDCYAFMEMARQEFCRISIGYPYVEKLWWPRFKRMSEGFLQVDAERKRSISKIDTDCGFSWKVSDEITVTSQCERVEYLKDGKLSIACYKVGSVPPQVDIQCGFEPRGIIESICATDSTGIEDVSFAYWRITPEAVEITEISDFANVLETARSGLKGFLVKYREEMTPFQQREDFSKFVEYELFSRIRERISIYSRRW
ncbi:hypothetical protein [Candidatus Anaplasma sp. TIGMIC]|uniref:hypothetical protein n=1 Tax=Candidatus Anaplasma sp. TIGMIC TaxID=3020713 RepID=UPI00232E2E23|nr:hypothetical protein [Candidatus Anaplasma sp. TIGMIC]MDB1135092.1 hypothetical protein [Candidatus Anaplasma sp. TIGMIC]